MSASLLPWVLWASLLDVLGDVMFRVRVEVFQDLRARVGGFKGRICVRLALGFPVSPKVMI